MVLHFQHFWESLPALCLLRKKKRNALIPGGRANIITWLKSCELSRYSSQWRLELFRCTSPISCKTLVLKDKPLYKTEKIQSNLPTLYKQGTLVLQHAMLFPVEILPLILLCAFLRDRIKFTDGSTSNSTDYHFNRCRIISILLSLFCHLQRPEDCTP